MDALLRTPSSSAQELELQQKEHVHVLHQNYKSSSNSSGSSEHHHPATASSTQKTNSSCSNPADDDDDECACQAAAVADEVQRLNLPVQLQKRTVMSNASNGSGARGYNHAAHDKEEVEEVEGDDESQEMNEIQKEHEQELHNNEAKGEGEEKTGNSNNITNQRLLGPILTQLVHHGGRLIAQVRKLAGTFVNHPTTQWIIVACIAVNALMMGIATYDFVKLDESVQHAFDVTDAVFLGIFTTELGLQFVDRGPLKLLTDAWLVFDLIIVVASWSFSGLQIIRAFRIFRALRLITRIKVMQNLVVALFGVIPRMFAIWLLLCLISYIFAVMFTQLFKNLYETGATGDTDYFGRMDKTFFTLFQIMTLDAWADIARDAMTVYPWAWLPIITYVIVTGFVVVNLVIAVICDAVAALHGDEKAKLLGQQIATVADDEDAGADATEQTKRKQTVEEVIAQNTAREQLSALEQHVDELAQMQEQALQSIVALTQQLANANQKMTMIPSTGTSEDLIRSPLLITTTAGASG